MAKENIDRIRFFFFFFLVELSTLFRSGKRKEDLKSLKERKDIFFNNSQQDDANDRVFFTWIWKKRVDILNH